MVRNLGAKLVVIFTVLYMAWHLGRYYEYKRVPPSVPVIDSAVYTESQSPAGLAVPNTVVLEGWMPELWGMVNNYRRANNLGVLSLDQSLCNYAAIRSNEIISDWSHGPFYADGCYRAGVVSHPWCGETLAKEFYDPVSLFASWVASPTHQAILVGDYSLGCVRDSYSAGVWFVALEVAR